MAEMMNYEQAIERGVAKLNELSYLFDLGDYASAERGFVVALAMAYGKTAQQVAHDIEGNANFMG